jgi:hypothetical protein
VPDVTIEMLRACLDHMVLPCGCETGTLYVAGEPTFVIMPHSLACEWYRYAVDESRDQGKPVEFRDVRGQ